MTDQRPITILCLASEYKGVPFIEECARQRARVILMTAEKYGGDPWPWEAIYRHYNMPDLHTQPNITNAVSYLAREYDIDRIVALDDYDVATAASLREHLRVPGIGETQARYFATNWPCVSRPRPTAFASRPSRRSSTTTSCATTWLPSPRRGC